MEQDKIKELLTNEDFVKSLFESGSYEAAQDKFKAEGIEVSTDELKSAVALLKKKANGELTDEDLEGVAGGSFTALIVAFGAMTAISVGTLGGLIAVTASRC